jgi:hypothetical protein
MSRPATRCLAGAAGIVTAVLLAGCDFGLSGSATTAPASSPSQSPTATPSLTFEAGDGACQASQLQLAVDRANAAAMQQPSAFLSLTNTSSTSCTLSGYPSFQPYTSSGQKLPVTVVQGKSYEIQDPGPQLITLAPGTAAYFGVGWSNANMKEGGTTAGCLEAASAQAVAPGDAESLTVGSFSALICPAGTATASISVTAVAPQNADWGGTQP